MQARESSKVGEAKEEEEDRTDGGVGEEAEEAVDIRKPRLDDNVFVVYPQQQQQEEEEEGDADPVEGDEVEEQRGEDEETDNA